MTASDTIFALATGSLPSALALVRVSGSRSRAMLAMLTRGIPFEPRKSVHCRIEDSFGEIIDDCLVTFFEGPNSFTGEDSVEFAVHGGTAIVDHLLETLGSFDRARLAEPGEFTRRAFENGKVDLTQAEAIVDLIEAETRLQKSQALAQLDGALSGVYAELRADLVEALALCEVMIDFTDEGDTPDDLTETIRSYLVRPRGKLGHTLQDDRAGERVRAGISIVLVGEPNAGKSSLINALTGRDVSIVTDIPGTTRDVVQTRMILAGVPVTLSDTAGLRETDDGIEREGVRRAHLAIDAADIVVRVADGRSASPQKFDLPVALTVATHLDYLDASPDWADASVDLRGLVGLSDVRDRLDQHVRRLLGTVESSVVTRARHRDVLGRAKAAVDQALSQLESGAEIELVAEDIRQAFFALETLVGRLDVEDVLGSVFSRFCIGK